VPRVKDIKISLHHLCNEITKELDTVYITSSGNKFLEEIDALCVEAQIQQEKKLQKRRRDKIMGIMKLVLKVLEEENWGFYYKNEPIRSLNTQDGGMLYEVNQVDLDEIERVLLNKLESTKEEKGASCREHTIHHSQQDEDLRQNEN